MTNRITWADTLDTIRDCVAADIENGNLTHDTDISEYAHEFADGAEWVIYTWQYRSLWMDSEEVQDYESDIMGMSIDRSIMYCVYNATYAAVTDEAQSQLDAKGMES